MAQLEQAVDALLAGETGAQARFQAQAEALARDPDIVDHAAPFVTEGYARLLNGLNSMGRADVSVALARHYLAQVHPHTSGSSSDPSRAYNASVIASQALAVALHRPQDAELVDEVMATLVGAHFESSPVPSGTGSRLSRRPQSPLPFGQVSGGARWEWPRFVAG